MRWYVRIEQRTNAKEENNELFPETDPRAWSILVDDVPAEIRTVTGGERIRGMTVEANVTTLVRIVFREDVTVLNRILHGSRILNIERATDVDGTRMYLTCQCREIA